MGVSPETYRSLLISCQIRDGDRKLDELMTILLKELQARGRATASEVASARSRDGSGRFLPPAAALLASMGGSGVTPACYYCQQPHLANACKNVASVEDRKRILKEASRCFVCLRRGHIVWQCTSKGRCPYCRGCHNGSICSSQKPGSGDPPDSGRSVPARTNSAGTNPTAATFQPSTVLLQTAQATAFNPVTPRCLAVFELSSILVASALMSWSRWRGASPW